MTVSPLWLHHADRVSLLVDGRLEADGRHEELVAGSAAYRSVVARILDDPDHPEPEEHAEAAIHSPFDGALPATTPYRTDHEPDGGTR